MKVRVGDITKIRTGKLDANASSEDGQYPFFTCSRDPLRISTYSYDCECVLVAGNGDLNVKYYNGKFDAYQRTYIIEDDSDGKLYMPYLYLFMERYVEELRRQAIGGVIKYIKLGNLTDALIELPVFEEQKSIVSILLKAKDLIEERNNLLKRMDELIKARFVEMFGEPIDNPMNWPVKRLKELSSLITNGNTPKGGSENYVDSGIIFLRSQNVWRNIIDLSDVAYIDEQTHRQLKKSSVHNNDILITKTGRINTENSSLGRAALYTGEDNSANINGHVYLIRLTEAVDPRFVVTILTGEAYRKYIRKVCVGGIDKRQINLDQVEDFPIILPPLEQQIRFSEFVEQVDKSKVLIQKSLDETQLLFDSLMQKFFGG